MERWSKERAWEWYNSRPWIRGCNYMSADCVNRVDQWQALHFDKRLETTETELKLMQELGFNSVMYDGSVLPEEENLKNTAEMVKIAARYGACVEAEVGCMGARESGAGSDESVYTDPETAKMFVEKTGVHALACAFGTAHGLYLKAPKLDFPRLAKIRDLVSVPLVMHGGSGVSPEDYKKVIELGVRKINYYSYMAKAGATAVKEMKDMTFYHDIEVAAIEGMRRDVKNAIELFR